MTYVLAVVGRMALEPRTPSIGVVLTVDVNRGRFAEKPLAMTSRTAPIIRPYITEVSHEAALPVRSLFLRNRYGDIPEPYDAVMIALQEKRTRFGFVAIQCAPGRPGNLDVIVIH